MQDKRPSGAVPKSILVYLATRTKSERKELDIMANMQKFTNLQVASVIRHVERQNESYSNEDIVRVKSGENYLLSPNREISSYDYYLKRKSEVWSLNRKDVVTCASWLITAPQTLNPKLYDDFFRNCYNFIAERYGGERNIVAAAVHMDETQPHMHCMFMPVKDDTKHEGFTEKLCAKEVVNRQDLRNFHPDLNKYLIENGTPADVYTGITKRQGGNLTVKQLKAGVKPEAKTEIKTRLNLDRFS